jgi:hypothetical protein
LVKANQSGTVVTVVKMGLIQDIGIGERPQWRAGLSSERSISKWKFSPKEAGWVGWKITKREHRG